MKNAIESRLGRVFLCGLVLSSGACGGHINLGEDAGATGGSGGGATGPSVEVPGCKTETDADTWIAFDSDRDDFDRELYLIRPNTTGLSRVTAHPGIDQEPAFSPDGKWLSFTSDRDGSLQIYLLDLANGDVTQVTHREGGADQSSFSHDGKLLAFHSGPSVFTIGIDGVDERLVASGPDSFNGYQHPQFTPDDTRLVVDRNNEIDVITLGSGEQRMIVQNWTTTIRAPWLSPSGRDVVYQVNCDFEQQASLWTSPYSVNTNPCEGVRITPLSAFDNQHPSWGPSDRIVYSRVDVTNQTGQIVIIPRARGATPCAVTVLGSDDRNPAWFVAAQ